MEKDNEVKGSGNSYDYGARFYDSRIGRFLSIDRKASTYPYFSTYLYAANCPIYFTDENGDGVKPPKNAWVESIVIGYGQLIYEAIKCSNNTSLRELERWAIRDNGFDKSTAWKIKGAVGEALVAYGIKTAMESDPDQVFSWSLDFQQKNADNDKSTPDIVMTVTVGEIKSWSLTPGNTHYIENEKFFVHPFNNQIGQNATQTFSDEVLALTPNKIHRDFETLY